MPDRETIIGWLLIVGVIAAILFGRQRGKARLVASMSRAHAEGRAELTAELNAMSSSAANVQVHTNVGNAHLVGDSSTAEFEAAVLRILRSDSVHGVAAVGDGSRGTADYSATYNGPTDDHDYPTGNDGDAIYRAVGRDHRTYASRAVPVDRAPGDLHRRSAAVDVASHARPVNAFCVTCLDRFTPLDGEQHCRRCTPLEHMVREPWRYDG